MKKIFTVLLVCLSFMLNAQSNMQFNRVIDTVLVVNIPPNTNMSTFPIKGDSFSPTSGKIWKVNNIELYKSEQPNIVYCSSGGGYSGSGMYLAMLINDGVNEISICAESFLGNGSTSITNGSDCTINYPLWINDASEFFPAVLTTYLDTDICVGNNSTSFVGKIYISLIEFNIVE